MPLWVLFLLGIVIWTGLIGVKQALPLQAKQLGTRLATKTQPVELVLSQAKRENSSNSKLQPFDEVVKDTVKSSGLFTLYSNKDTGKIYLEVQPQQLNQNFLSTITMESGIGERGCTVDYLCKVYCSTSAG